MISRGGSGSWEQDDCIKTKDPGEGNKREKPYYGHKQVDMTYDFSSHTVIYLYFHSACNY